MIRQVLGATLIGGLTICLVAGNGRAGEEIVKTKGQLKIGAHRAKLEAGKLYEVRVQGEGFRPLVILRPSNFWFPLNTESSRDLFRAYVVPKETKENQLFVTPDLYDADLDDGPLDYSLTIKSIPLEKKPVLEEKAELTEKDPVYNHPDLFGKRDCFSKAYPIKMKARQFYIIEMVRKDDQLDPYLYLEGADKKIVAQDDDGAGNLNARIIYQPRKDGEHRIIATTLRRATGEFTLTVRAQAKE